MGRVGNERGMGERIRHTAIATWRSVCVVTAVVCVGTAWAQGDANALANPGFEAAAGWSHGWTIENVNNNGSPYVYHVTAIGGGHGKARPRTGDHAIEIYSSDRVTRLSQQVTLAAGRYRLAAWVRNNGASIDPQLVLMLGDQSVTVPTLSDRYRQVFADFEVRADGSQRIAFMSRTLGLALDDVSLTRLTGNEPTPPYLFFDLSPTSEERSGGVQTYIPHSDQWINFTISTTAPKLVKNPRLRLLCPQTPGVSIGHFNQPLLETWKWSASTDAKISVGEAVREGRTYTVTEFALPRFVNGWEHPVSFGGCWLEDQRHEPSIAFVELLNDGQVVSTETLTLQPVEQAPTPLIPKRYKIVFYGVQDWKMEAQMAMATLPFRFPLMGGNVWSDYTIARGDYTQGAFNADILRQQAAKPFGVKEFWPNYSSLLETGEGISAWQSVADQYHDPDMFMVGPDGTVNKRMYNLRYAAGKGGAWVNSALKAYQDTLTEPQAHGREYRNTGFITDALEGVPMSYDATTLADFAKLAGLDAATVTVETVRGPLAKQWLAYNMGLYNQVAANVAEALRQVYPNAAVVNTAGAYGPGGVGSLSLPEQAAWAQAYDYTMPQWYSMGFYGDYYVSLLEEGLRAGLYGKPNGHADVIPLWNLSMGAGIESPLNLRFKVFDTISYATVVKGAGYYIGTNAFADARTMVGLAELHTLLAKVEDYYARGERADEAATFEPAPGGVTPIPAMDPEGKQTTLVPQVKTTVRVHRLGKSGRVALLTVVSHCNQGVGERGTVTLDLKALGADVKRDVLVDHMTGKTLPLTAAVEVDTSRSGNLAVLEVRRR